MNGFTAAQVKTRFIAGMVIAVLVGIVALIAVNYMDTGDVNKFTGVHMVAYALVDLLGLGPWIAGSLINRKNKPKIRWFSISSFIRNFIPMIIWSANCLILGYRGIVWALSRGDEE